MSWANIIKLEALLSEGPCICPRTFKNILHRVSVYEHGKETSFGWFPTKRY
jgi:hypothetical protein